MHRSQLRKFVAEDSNRLGLSIKASLQLAERCFEGAAQLLIAHLRLGHGSLQACLHETRPRQLLIELSQQTARRSWSAELLPHLTQRRLLANPIVGDENR